MNYVFFGSPEFAAIILRKLIEAGMPPTALVCNPDRPVGRKQIVTPPATKRVISEGGLVNSITLLQPEDLKAISSKLKAYHADLFIVAAYAKILSPELLAVPKFGALGVHPSLLPKYRGTTPIQFAMLNGEKETGVTIYVLDPKVDNGPIVANRKAPIAHRTYTELMQELAELGGDLLVEVIPKFLKGEIKPVPQDGSQATYTKKLKTEDGFVPLRVLRSAESGGREAETVWRKIRALNPEPGVWTIDERGKRVKLLEAEVRDGKLVITKIQEEGKLPRKVEAKIDAN
jgi:methionyl-tRNA formyltransferase